MTRSLVCLLFLLLAACASDSTAVGPDAGPTTPDFLLDASNIADDTGDDAGGDAVDVAVVDAADALSLPDAPPGPARAASGCDIDGDGKADRLVFARAGGQWRGVGSQVGEVAVSFGWLNVEPLCGDFDGDGVSDLAVYHPAAARWYLRSSRQGGATVEAEFGYAPSQPVPADYDGDGITDLAVYNPVVATWYVFGTVGGFREEVIGESHERPVPADYDGDGRVDLATFSPSTGRWLIHGTRDGVRELTPGWAGREPVPADYDGDGLVDPAVFSAGRWELQGSRAGAYTADYGYEGVVPCPADYDGDGRADVAVYDPVSQRWYVFGTVVGHTEVALGVDGQEGVAVVGGPGPARYGTLTGGDGFLYKPDTHLVLLPGRMRQFPVPGGDAPVDRVVVSRDPAGTRVMAELALPADWEADGTNNANFGGRPKWRYNDHDGAAFGTNFFVVAFFANGDPPQPWQIFDGAVRQE